MHPNGFNFEVPSYSPTQPGNVLDIPTWAAAEKWWIDWIWGDGGIVGSIVAFQAIDPSSILGHRI